MSDGSARCCRRSLALDESLHGTASTVRGWLLLEEPGPWGVDALRDSRLDPKVAAGLDEMCRRLRLRALLVRRHGRSTGSARHCFVAWTGPEGGWIEETLLDDPAEVLDIDLEGLVHGERPGLRQVTHPLYLVCTQGRHDPCCAELGRPLARALSEGFPEQTWEVSHIGGDRFAGNLVVLPHGLYFGRVPPDQAVPVATAYSRGEIEPAYLRGRSAYGFATQAAECILRREHGIRGLEDLPLVSTRRTGEETEAVFAAPGGGHYLVRVRTVPADPARSLTCHARRIATPPEHHVVELRYEAA